MICLRPHYSGKGRHQLPVTIKNKILLITELWKITILIFKDELNFHPGQQGACWMYCASASAFAQWLTRYCHIFRGHLWCPWWRGRPSPTAPRIPSTRDFDTLNRSHFCQTMTKLHSCSSWATVHLRYKVYCLGQLLTHNARTHMERSTHSVSTSYTCNLPHLTDSLNQWPFFHDQSSLMLISHCQYHSRLSFLLLVCALA